MRGCNWTARLGSMRYPKGDGWRQWVIGCYVAVSGVHAYDIFTVSLVFKIITCGLSFTFLDICKEF